MLWRALGHIPNGVYVDVGAQHPRIDSISRAFYERGWRGTHIEPVPAFADLLRQDRPEEKVLQLAIGEQDGTLELNVFADTGLSTAIADYAERHQAERGYEVQRITVPVLTLNTALRSLEGTDVHWLKIDVEGFEEQVLRGWDSTHLRPWVLVVEATIPNSPDTDYASWEPVVLAAGYRFVYFDSLNRFYVADEHAELADAFQVPPNIFDAVEVSGQASWELYRHVVANHQAELDALGEKLARSDAAAQRLETAERELASEREVHGHMQARLDTMRAQYEKAQRGLASSVAHIEWMQGQHDAEAARLHTEIDEIHGKHAAERANLHAEIASMQGKLDAEAVRMHADFATEKKRFAAEETRLHTHIAWMQGKFDEEEARLHKHIAWMEGQIDAALRASHDSAASAEALRRQVDAMYASTSWRVTGPLRRAVNLARRIKRKLFGAPAPAPAPVPVPQSAASFAPAAAFEEQAPRELSPRATRILAEIRAVVDAKAN